MQIVDKKTMKAKAFAINTIMNNPKLSKIMMDAWDAPVGSTKKKKAKSIMQSLHKTHRNRGDMMDGMGGPAPMMNPFASFVGGAAPQTGSLLGTSSPQFNLGTGTSTLRSPSLIPPSDNYGLSLAGGTTAPTNNVFLQSIDDLIAKTKPSMTPLEATAATTTPSYKYNPVTGKVEPIIAGTAGVSGAPIKPSDIFKTAEKSKIPKESPKKPGDIKMYEDGTYSYMNKDGTIHIGMQGEPYVDRTIPKAKTPQELGIGFETEDTSRQIRLSPRNKTAATGTGTVVDTQAPGETVVPTTSSILKEAYETGAGSTAFALGILNDRKKLALFTGMPESELARIFPVSGGLLNSQLSALFETAKKENNLDAMYQQLTDAANRNLSISGNITSYIRGKDEYLKDLDDLKKKASAIGENTDLSNPAIAQQYNNYMDYLTILEGRQSQRYVDMLNMAILDDNNRYQRLTNQYNILASKAQQDYTNAANITTELYTSTKEMLKEMYDNIEARAGIEADNTKKKMDILSSMYQWAEKSIELLEKGAVLSIDEKTGKPSLLNTAGEPLEPEDIIDNKTKAITNLSVIDSLMGVSQDADKKLVFSTYDPMQALSAVKAQGGDDITKLTRYGTLAGQYLDQVGATGNFKSEWMKFNPYMNNMQTDWEENPDNGYAQVINSMKSGLSTGIQKFLLSRIEKVREAIADLTTSGFWKGGKITDRAEFIKKYSGELGDIAGMLFDLMPTVSKYNMDLANADNNELAASLASALAERTILSDALAGNTQ